MRLKLVCVLGAILFLFMYMCSCVAKVEAQSEGFDVRQVYYDSYGITIYRVITPNGSAYVARYGQGLCTIN